MQIEKFIRFRNVCIVLSIICAILLFVCYRVDNREVDVDAMYDYISYSRQAVETDSYEYGVSTYSCSVLLRNDSIFKSNPDMIPAMKFCTVDEMEKFVNGWEYAETHNVNPYVNSYIKQSLWEYANWCIDEESDDYWHMKYIASQKTGGYSYARQIKYKWYKRMYESIPYLAITYVFIFVFLSTLCILYVVNGTILIKRKFNK